MRSIKSKVLLAVALMVLWQPLHCGLSKRQAQLVACGLSIATVAGAGCLTNKCRQENDKLRNNEIEAPFQNECGRKAVKEILANNKKSLNVVAAINFLGLLGAMGVLYYSPKMLEKMGFVE